MARSGGPPSGAALSQKPDDAVTVRSGAIPSDEDPAVGRKQARSSHLLDVADGSSELDPALTMGSHPRTDAAACSDSIEPKAPRGWCSVLETAVRHFLP